MTPAATERRMGPQGLGVPVRHPDRGGLKEDGNPSPGVDSVDGLDPSPARGAYRET